MASYFFFFFFFSSTGKFSAHFLAQIPGPWPARGLAALGSHVHFSLISHVRVGHMAQNIAAKGAQGTGERLEVRGSLSYLRQELRAVITLVTN